MASLDPLLASARAAQRALARTTADRRTAALESIARALSDPERRAAVLAANAEDLRLATDLSPAMRDRLALTPSRLDGVIASGRGVAPGACAAPTPGEPPMAVFSTRSTRWPWASLT